MTGSKQMYSAKHKFSNWQHYNQALVNRSSLCMDDDGSGTASLIMVVVSAVFSLLITRLHHR